MASCNILAENNNPLGDFFRDFCFVMKISSYRSNCNYNLFTKLPRPGYSEGTFRSSSQAATCPPVYHTRRRLHTVPLIAERQAGKLVNTKFYSLWFDPTENRTRVYRFSSRRSIHSTTDRLTVRYVRPGVYVQPGGPGPLHSKSIIC